MSNQPRVQSAELQTALEAALSQTSRTRTRIVDLRRRRSRYSSSFALENLEVKLAGGGRLSLVFKDSSPAALLPEARDVRPQFLYDPLREIEVYRTILDPERFGTPAFHGAVARPDLQRYWLFLERVPGPLLWQVGDIETWRQAARWLAQFHTTHYVQGRPNPGSRHIAALLRYNRPLLELWWNRAERFLSGRASGSVIERQTLRHFIRLTGRRDQVIDRIVQLPYTFVHGEFYPSNVILRRQDAAMRICPIDWEVAGIGPGLIDLAALTSGAWGTRQKKTMITAYREAAAPTRCWPPSLPELLETVEYCQLHLAIQWLGWAADWSPPKMHSHNWLREAVRLSTALGI